MAAYSDIVATLGGSTSNSYVTGANADQYFLLQSTNALWTAETESDRTIALLSAATWLDTLKFAGTRCQPSTDDPALPQRRAWPRSDVSCDGVSYTCSAIPLQIINAQCRLALELVVNPDLITGSPGGGGGGAAAGTFTKRQRLGDLEIEFEQYSGTTVTSCDNCNDPKIITAFPWLRDLLGCLLQGGVIGGVGLIARVRS